MIPHTYLKLSEAVASSHRSNRKACHSTHTSQERIEGKFQPYMERRDKSLSKYIWRSVSNSILIKGLEKKPRISFTPKARNANSVISRKPVAEFRRPLKTNNLFPDIIKG